MKKKALRKLLFWSGILVSFVLLFFVLVLPAISIIDSFGWIEVECLIVEKDRKQAGINQSRYGNSVKYKYELKYKYHFDDKDYFSNHYAHIGHSGIGSLRRGEKTICYVNPSAPQQAVLSRGYPPIYLLISALPAVMIWGCIYGLRQGRK